MSRARELLRLFRRLVSRVGFDPFAPDAGERLNELLATTRTSRASVEPVSLLDAIQSMWLWQSETQATRLDAEFVMTVPRGFGTSARSTAMVIREMLSGAPAQVIALGYEITDSDVVQQIHGAASRGASVLLICDRERGSGRDLLLGWPSGVTRPSVYRDCVRADATPHAKMHGKALLVGEEDVLITSANFTFHGLQGNVELGVRLRGQPASEARAVVKQLLDSGLLERVGD